MAGGKSDIWYGGASWPVYGAAAAAEPDLDTPNFPTQPSSSSCIPPKLYLQVRMWPAVLFSGCLASSQKLPERVDTHSEFWSCSSWPAARPILMRLVGRSVQAAVRLGGQSKLSPQAGPQLKPGARPVPGNARDGLKPLHHIHSLSASKYLGQGQKMKHFRATLNDENYRFSFLWSLNCPLGRKSYSVVCGLFDYGCKLLF